MTRVPAQKRYGFAVVDRISGELQSVTWTRGEARRHVTIHFNPTTHRVDRVRIVPCAIS